MRNRFKVDSGCCCSVDNPSPCYSPSCYYFNDGSNNLAITQSYIPSNGSYNTSISSDPNIGLYSPSQKIVIEKTSGAIANTALLIELINNVGVNELGCNSVQSISVCMSVKNENTAYFIRYVPYIIQNGAIYIASMTQSNSVDWNHISSNTSIANYNKLTISSTNGSWNITNTQHPSLHLNFSMGIIAFSAFSAPNVIATGWIDNICVQFGYAQRHPTIYTHTARVTLDSFLLSTSASSHPVPECRLTNNILSDVAGGIVGDWIIGGLPSQSTANTHLWRYCAEGVCDATKIQLGTTTMWLDLHVAYNFPSSGADLISGVVRFYLRPVGCQESNIPVYTVLGTNYKYLGKRTDVTCNNGIFYGTVTIDNLAIWYPFELFPHKSSPWSIVTDISHPITINIVWEPI